MKEYTDINGIKVKENDLIKTETYKGGCYRVVMIQLGTGLGIKIKEKKSALLGTLKNIRIMTKENDPECFL